MFQFVHLELVVAGVGHAADLADVRLLARVDPHVLF